MKIPFKIFFLLLFISSSVMADNFTDETLDLMLDCKGDGYFHDFEDNTYAPISSNVTLHIKTDKNGRKNTLYFWESDWFCLTTTTEIKCYNQNKYQKDFEQKVKENPFIISLGKIVINRLSGDAEINIVHENSSAKSNVVCKNKSQKF